MRETPHTSRAALLVDMDEQVQPQMLRRPVTKGDHLVEFPGRVDMQHRERQPRRIRRLDRQMHLIA